MDIHCFDQNVCLVCITVHANNFYKKCFFLSRAFIIFLSPNTPTLFSALPKDGDHPRDSHHPGDGEYQVEWDTVLPRFGGDQG